MKQQIQIEHGIDAGAEVVALGLLSTSEARQLKKLGPQPETIKQVARVYRLAEFMSDAPTKAIEDAFEVSRSTAGAWIGRARSAGLIPQATPTVTKEPEIVVRRAPDAIDLPPTLRTVENKERTHGKA
ncbi:hypothetical protein FXW78_55035 [Rhodococcus opacus]|nr:hypothetical protein [Rhodococcus opacus]